MEPDFFDAFLPPYPGGRVLGTFDGGSGMTDDAAGLTPANGRIRLIGDTAEEAFFAYCRDVEAAGFPCRYEFADEGGVYRAFGCGDRFLYAYFVPSEGVVRLICDRAGLLPADFAEAGPYAPESGAALMQFGLYYSEMVKGTTCDCGMMYVLRLPNGEFVIVDGGEREQATDAAVEEFLTRIRALAGGDNFTVALWFCTHPHDDHMDFFIKLLRVCRDTMTVRRLMFNFPAMGLLGNADAAVYAARLRARLGQCCAHVPFLQPHTGERFCIGGAEFRVLLTHEDVLHADGRAYRGVNETSTVLKIDFAGQSLLLLADIPEENAEKLLARYRIPTLACTYLQAAHHCINRLEELYKNVPADLVLIPEELNIIKDRMRDNFAVICRYHQPETIYCSGNGTVVFSVRNGGTVKTERFPVVGGAYDGSEL